MHKKKTTKYRRTKPVKSTEEKEKEKKKGMYRRIEAVKSTEKKKSTSTEVPNRVPTFFTEKVGTTDFGSVR